MSDNDKATRRKRVMVLLTDRDVDRLDVILDGEPRSAWIRQLIRRKLYGTILPPEIRA